MKNRSLIEELYNSFLFKRKEALQSVINYEEEISALDKFLDSVNINDDFKFFSPHSADMFFDADINSKREKKEALSLEIERLNSLIDEYNHSLSGLKEILQDEELKENINENISENINDNVNKNINEYIYDNVNENINENIYDNVNEHINENNREDNITELSVFNIVENKNLDDISINQNSLASNFIDSKAFDIQENERRRIASDLHDTTVQNLVHLVHSLELASMFINQDPVRAKIELELCSKNLKDTIEGIRDIIFNLRPMSFDDLDFKQCIDDFINNLKLHYPSVVFNYEVDDLDKNVDFNITVFRIIQECVNNSLKHSKSPDLFLTGKKTENFYEIKVKDNGIGFDCDLKKNNHFGLKILQDRVNLINGKLDIFSNSSGTQICIVFPL